MPHKANAARRHHIPQPKRRVLNWAEYDAALRKRGSLTVWVTAEAIAHWKAAPRTTPGRQPSYSDLAITTALMPRAVFRLALGQTEGLIGSVLLGEHAEVWSAQAAFKVTGAEEALTAMAGYHTMKVSRRVPSRVRVRIWTSRWVMMQTLLETGARVSEFVALRVEDVSLAERVITIIAGKGGKRHEVPIRPELARLLALHIGKRRVGPLFASREKGTGAQPHVYTRQRIGQMVREVADAAGTRCNQGDHQRSASSGNHPMRSSSASIAACSR